MAFTAAATATSDFLTGRKPTIQGTDNTTISERFVITLGTADLANGIVGAVGILPAGHVPVALEIDADQLDSNGTPTLAYSVGVLNAGQTAIDTSVANGAAAWLTAQTFGRTAGGVASGVIPSRPLKKVTQMQTDRLIGVVLTAAAATAVAGQLAFTLHYRPA